MASKQTTVDFILEQMAEAGDVSARKMFGEYGVYCGGKLVALVCDEQLFMKPTAAGRSFIGKITEGAPYPGAKPWFLVAGSRWEDGDWLAELVRLTAELPTPSPKTKKAKSKAAKSKLAKPQRPPSKTAKSKAKLKPSPRPKPQPQPQPRKTVKPKKTSRRV